MKYWLIYGHGCNRIMQVHKGKDIDKQTHYKKLEWSIQYNTVPNHKVNSQLINTNAVRYLHDWND